jgi:hypothetical protein
MIEMKKIAALTLCMFLAASLAMASNTGFKLNYNLRWTAGYANTNWVSLPYFYHPDGNVNNSPQHAWDVCNDINATAGGSVVSFITKWDVINNIPVTNLCGPILNFDLDPGMAIGIVPTQDNVRYDIVGSHDDDFDGSSQVTLRWQAGYANTNWISVPYHTTLSQAWDVCNELEAQNGGPVVSFITTWDVVNNIPITNLCGPILNFDLDPGLGIAVVPTQDNVTWNPTHY